MSKFKFISIVTLILLSLLFVPRKYEVEQFELRQGTEYWNLP